MTIVDILSDPETGKRLAKCRGTSEFLSWRPGSAMRGDDGHGGACSADLPVFGAFIFESAPKELDLLTGGIVISSSEILLLATWLPEGLVFGESPAIDLTWRMSTGRSCFSLLSKEKRSVEIPSMIELVSLVSDEEAMLDFYTEGCPEPYAAVIALLGLKPTAPRGAAKGRAFEWMREDLAPIAD